MQVEVEPRVKKRLPCTLQLADGRRSGLILNLSQRGMFIQTSLPAEPGTLMEVDFWDPSRGQPIALQAAVVWRQRVSPRMTGINQSGMGMRIPLPPAPYDELVAEILSPPRAAPAPGDASPPERSRYVVRLGQLGGPRSRRIVVHGDSEEHAREQAAAELGEGWSILEVSEG